MKKDHYRPGHPGSWFRCLAGRRTGVDRSGAPKVHGDVRRNVVPLFTEAGGRMYRGKLFVPFASRIVTIQPGRLAGP